MSSFWRLIGHLLHLLLMIAHQRSQLLGILKIGIDIGNPLKNILVIPDFHTIARQKAMHIRLQILNKQMGHIVDAVAFILIDLV